MNETWSRKEDQRDPCNTAGKECSGEEMNETWSRKEDQRDPCNTAENKQNRNEHQYYENLRSQEDAIYRAVD
ncbi:hypothetical protein QE152_g12553 [Popillia japonica]|uniref:Uncharacterized protein n=1 Tax=Popillia japonica TaxID=7064 RepID=A0AAW1LNT5_POPJA